MASSASGTSVAVFTCLCVFALTSADQQITVKTGDDVTLHCLDHRRGDIKLLEWKRQDQEKDVFVWKNGEILEDLQHPSFKNRVELRDPQMKDGDVSVILKNVTINDTGTYECYVRNSNKQPPPQLINSTNLTVTDSGTDERGGDNDGDNHRHLKLVLTVFFVSVILVGIVYVIHRKCNGHFKKNSDVSPPDEAADQQPT